MSLKMSPGVAHDVPADVRKVLAGNSAVLDRWESLTPLARNEWLCWIEFAKAVETRNKRITRLAQDLLKGKRRPCCWPGCTHR